MILKPQAESKIEPLIWSLIWTDTGLGQFLYLKIPEWENFDMSYTVIFGILREILGIQTTAHVA